MSGGRNYVSKAEASHHAWLAWLDKIDRGVRIQITNTLRQIDLSDPNGFSAMSKEIMLQVLEGRIPPAISNELREWAAIVSKHLVTAKETGGGVAGAINVLIDAKSSAPKPSKPLPDYGVLDAIAEETPIKSRVRK